MTTTPDPTLSRLKALLKRLKGAAMLFGSGDWSQEVRDEMESIEQEIRGMFEEATNLERQRSAEVARDYLADLEGCDMSENEPDLIAAAILAPPKP